MRNETKLVLFFVIASALLGFTQVPIQYVNASLSLVGLGFLPGASPPAFSEANGVSADGSVIVGQSSSAGFPEAFMWTSGGGMTGLGFLPGAAFDTSLARAISADGSVIVGQAANSAGFPEAIMWTSGGGMTGLGFLPSATFDLSEARATSADGSVIVGFAINSAGDTEAFMTGISQIVVGGEFYPVDNVSLVLAYGLVNSWWMAPIGIGIGVGIYLVKRRF